MIHRIVFPVFALVVLTLSSCKTYIIPMESFRQQFFQVDSAYFNKAYPQLTGRKYTYLVNRWDTIHCEDKHHRPAILLNGPSIEMRLTYGPDNRRTVIYFDTMYLTDSTLSGVRSRFLPSLRSTILLNSITKIEVQDGHKQIHYINQDKP